MSKEQLVKFAEMTNIAQEGDFSEEELLELGHKALNGFNDDLNSQSEWLADVKKVEELASLTSKKKNTPIPNAANIKFPLITKAVYEFSSRTYPEIVKDGKIVKARVLGLDPTGVKAQEAARVSDFMNYQLLYETTDWEQELEKLLNQLPLIGFVCKKSYYDPVRKQIRSDIVNYCDLIVSADAKNLKDALRISHIQHLKLNSLIESSRAGVFCQEPIDKLIERTEGDVSGQENDDIDVIEQQTYLDLDDDGYKEPYFITFLRESGEVLRIAPRYMEEDINTKKDIKTKEHKVVFIDPIDVYTDFHFLANPKGKFQGVGFGMLMLHLNETINSVLNQLVDAGQLANMQGGYIDSKVKGIESNQNRDPGTWQKVKTSGGMNLKDGIMPITYKEPSSVLQQLFGVLVDAGKDLSSSSEVMSGNQDASNAKTGAVMALQQAGLKIFTSIYKGIYRSLGSEFKKIAKLNAKYLDPEKYYNVLDDEKAIFQDDFESKTLDIIPVADPNLSSETQKQGKIQALAALLQLPPGLIDPKKVTARIVELSDVDKPEDLMMEETGEAPPNPDVLKLQAEAEQNKADNEFRAQELELRKAELQMKSQQMMADIALTKAQTMLAAAKADSEVSNLTFAQIQKQLDALTTDLQQANQTRQMDQQQMMHQDEMALRQQELEAQQMQQMETPTDVGSPETMA